jgi:hypothetical protein
MSTRCTALALMFLITGGLAACGAEEAPSKSGTDIPAAAAPVAKAAPPVAKPAKPTTPDTLPNGIVLALAQFVTEKGDDGKDKFVPGAARLEFLYREGGSWKTSEFEDPDSNVFHKAMVYDAGEGPRLLTLGGTRAILKTWELTDSGMSGTVLWEKDFGGKFSRMRDAEIADLKGDGTSSIAVATHDKGVVAKVHPTADGYEIEEIDEKENTFVHEIEVGDLNGDGVIEIYATPSEPNRLDGRAQKGEVVRYLPGGERSVVADLGERHAKEILVADVDGDGKEELYVSVEGEIEGKGGSKTIKSPVKILRYEADTPADQGVEIAELKDSLSRFLTVGDVDGDGKNEMVAAAFSSGLWLLRPGDDPNAKWTAKLIDRDSAGFEHASILADLDGDGTVELYVASDRHKEVRRYVWDGRRMKREVIYKRPDDRPVFTWNLMPVPVSLIPSAN